MAAEFKLDPSVTDTLSETTKKVLISFLQILERQEGMLREYHKDTSALLVDRTGLSLDNLKASTRLIVTMYLTKTIYYSRAIIENVSSQNLLVAFQCMRALIEVLAAVRYTLTASICPCCATGQWSTAYPRQGSFPSGPSTGQITCRLHTRMRAAISALPHEVPRLAVTAVVSELCLIEG